MRIENDIGWSNQPEHNFITVVIIDNNDFVLLKLIWLGLNLCRPSIHKLQSVYAKAYTAYTMAPPMPPINGKCTSFIFLDVAI